MSYDVSLYIETGAGNSVCAFDGNMTSNVAPMWRKAGVDLTDLHELEARDCVEPLAKAIHAMEVDPAAYKLLDPPNGWGDYEGCLRFLKDIHDACLAHPNCLVHVSH